MFSIRRSARPPRRKLIGSGWACVLTVFAAGCIEQVSTPLEPSSPGAPEVTGGSAVPGSNVQSVPAGQLQLLRHDPSQPQPTTFDTSFVAEHDERIQFRLFFDNGNGSDRLVDFDLHNETLYRYPPGHPMAGQLFEPGDTITIRVHVDPVTLAVTFTPAGLEFNPDEPARLELNYKFADPDFDEDGVPDPELEPDIEMWRQDSPGDPWFLLDTEQDLLRDRIRADIFSFSRYAAAI